MGKKIELKKISVVAMLTAVAYLCMFLFKFKVGFLTFDFKDAFLAIISFIYGPFYSIISAIVVAFFEFLSVSDTGIYGFIMNALSSAVFAGTCGFVYKYKHTFSGAIFGAVSAVTITTVVMLLANLFITPYYMGVSRGDVAAMIPTLLLPFNLIKGVVNMGITLIIYKPITIALKKTRLIEPSVQNTDIKKFVIMGAIALIIVAFCIFSIFYFLHGSLELNL